MKKPTRTAVLRLRQLVELADQRADAAGLEMRRTRASLEQSEERLRMLDEYRESHAEQRRPVPGQAIALLALHNATRFLGRLDAARDQQNAEVVRRKAQVETSQSAWQSECRRVQSFETLESRAKRVIDASDRQREQRMLDEMAQRARSTQEE